MQSSGREFFFKFSAGLHQEFSQVQLLHIQCYITGACPGSFHQVIGKLFETLRFLVQHFQIFVYLRIIDLLTLHEIHIIDDGGQRSLQIMRYVGDQICFHLLALYLLLKSIFKSLTQIIDRLRHLPIASGQMLGIDRSLTIAVCNGSDSIQQLLSLQTLPQKSCQYSSLSDNDQDLYRSAVSEDLMQNHLDQLICQEKYNDPYRHRCAFHHDVCKAHHGHNDPNNDKNQKEQQCSACKNHWFYQWLQRHLCFCIVHCPC